MLLLYSVAGLHETLILHWVFFTQYINSKCQDILITFIVIVLLYVGCRKKDIFIQYKYIYWVPTIFATRPKLKWKCLLVILELSFVGGAYPAYINIRIEGWKSYKNMAFYSITKVIGFSNFNTVFCTSETLP